MIYVLSLCRVGVLYPLSPTFPDSVAHARFDKDRMMLKHSILGSVEEFATELKSRKLVSTYVTNQVMKTKYVLVDNKWLSLRCVKIPKKKWSTNCCFREVVDYLHEVLYIPHLKVILLFCFWASQLRKKDFMSMMQPGMLSSDTCIQAVRVHTRNY